MKKHLFTLIIIVLSRVSTAQSLSGMVRDSQTNLPIPGVSVRLLPTLRGTLTNERGSFQMPASVPGTYTLQISAVGYRPVEEVIITKDGQPWHRDIRLRPTAVQLNQQTVTTLQRSEMPDFTRPEITTVLTARDLRQRAPRSVPDALFGATGVFMQKTNHGGGSPFVRGLTGQQTLLLIDGIRLNNATFRSGPNQYLNTIDPQSVGQIEVVRSSGSVSYGSDAIGGVVNVLTRTPQFADRKTFTGGMFAKAMTQGMEYSGRAEAGFSSPSVAVAGAVAYRKFGDLVAGRGLGRQTPTGYGQVSGDVKARFRLSDRFVATVAYQQLQQDSVPVYHKIRLENFALNQLNPQRRQLAYARLERFFNRPFLTSAQLTASWQRQTEGRQSQKNGSLTAVYERDETTTTGLTLVATAGPTRHWQLQQGVEWYYDRVGSRREEVNAQTRAVLPTRGLYPNGATMSSMALFSLHTFTFNKLTVTGGGRYNAFAITIPEQTAGMVTIRPSALVGNVGTSFALAPTVRLVASLQSAFRAPNIDDLGTLGIVDFRYEVPNAQLKPERSLNKEVGVKVRTERFSATVLAYHNKLTNFISRVRAGGDSLRGYPVYLKQNSAEAYIRGLEAEAEYALWPNWLAYAGVTFTHGQNRTANEPFRRIPPLNGRIGLTYQPAATGWWARFEFLYAGAQTRLAKGDRDDNRIAKGGTPAWQVMNLNGGYRWHAVTISAELQNLTNAAYRTHGSGLDGTGRSAWLSVLVNR